MPTAAAPVPGSSLSNPLIVTTASAPELGQPACPAPIPGSSASYPLTIQVASVHSAGTPESHWTTYVQIWATPVVALIAAAIASTIAWRQWKTAEAAKETARDKLKLDLFEGRLEVFNATVELFTAKLDSIKAPPEYHNFYKAKSKAQFLFENDVQDYMRSIADKVEDVRPATETKQDDHEPPEELVSDGWEPNRAASLEALSRMSRRSKAASWLLHQYAPCQDVFGRYMDFGSWR